MSASDANGSSVTELVAVDYKAPDAAEKFVKSLRETGFGVLKNHPIAASTVNGIYSSWSGFFARDNKRDFLYDAAKYDGFFPTDMAEAALGRSVRDIKEYFHFYPAWGRCPEDLREELTAYYKEAMSLASELLSWVEKYTPTDTAEHFTEPLPKMIEGGDQTLLRVLHYPPLPDAVTPGAIRAGAHEDINLMTILPAANEPGLQIRLNDGSWVDVPCDHGNLIVNIGDMLQEASRGYYPSTTHRVINPEGVDARKSRISLPMFVHPRPEVVLSERYTAGAFLDERLSKNYSANK